MDLDLAGLPAWFDQAACVDADPDAFFSERGHDAGPALAICARCPVRAPCADYAAAEGIVWGVWGGLSEDDRREARTAARRAA